MVSGEENLANTATELFKLKPSFTVRCSYDFSESDKAKIADSISITNVASDSIEKTWVGKDLVLNVTHALNTATDYRITMSEDTKLAGIRLEPMQDYSFETMEDVRFSLRSSATNVFDDKTGRYILNPNFVITSNYEFSDAEKRAFAESVSVSNVASESVKKEWDGDSLILTFDSYLSASVSFEITMDEPKGLEEFNIVKFDDMPFNTMEPVSLTVESDDGNVFDENSGLFVINPTFTVKSSYEFSDIYKKRIADCIKLSDVDSDSLV